MPSWQIFIPSSRIWRGRNLAACAIAGALICITGCRLDMQDQPKYKPLRETVYYPDQRSARPLVAGTIPRGSLQGDSAFSSGLDANGNPGDALPFPLTRQVLVRGRERFNIYCSPCHSELGDGNGMIVQRGYLRPPSLHEDRLRKAPLGHFFDVMTNGLGGMPDYAQQVSQQDRWDIAAYIRALQLSQNATLADVPPQEQPNLGKPLPSPSEGLTGKTDPQRMAPPLIREERPQ